MGLKLKNGMIAILRVPWEATNLFICTLEQVSSRFCNIDIYRSVKVPRLRRTKYFCNRQMLTLVRLKSSPQTLLSEYFVALAPSFEVFSAPSQEFFSNLLKGREGAELKVLWWALEKALWDL